MSNAEYYLPQAFLAFFRERAKKEKSLALISVLSTEGSTYSKAGMQMLVDEDSLAQGMLSGGCLEGDLADRVTRSLDNGAAEVVTYDLTDDDSLFGLGVGCEGTMRVLVLPLTLQGNYEPLAGWISQLEIEGAVDIDLSAYCPEGEKSGGVRIFRPRSVVVLGAGKDAEPLVSFAQNLGWRVSVYDHRPAYLENPAIQCADALHCADAGDVSERVDLQSVDAAIVMSHNLVADATYLRVLAESQLGFIGLIGPPHRRDRLLSELGEQAAKLGDRLHAPVGTRIGGRGPSAIALEIVAELQAYFSADRS